MLPMEIRTRGINLDVYVELVGERAALAGYLRPLKQRLSFCDDVDALTD